MEGGDLEMQRSDMGYGVELDLTGSAIEGHDLI
jgi:hypothetical protein